MKLLCLAAALLAPALSYSQVSFTASPDPFAPLSTSGAGQITLSWSAPSSSAIEIHIGAANGALFASGGPIGAAATGAWVVDGETFYLQDVRSGEPGSTLATVTAHEGFPGLPANMNLLLPSSDGQHLAYVAPSAAEVEIHLAAPDGPLLARFATPQGVAATGGWVATGMRFFLQDVSGGKPLSYANTLASTVVTVLAHQSPPVIFGASPGVVLDSTASGIGATNLYWYTPRSMSVAVHIGAANGPLFGDGGNAGFAQTGDWVTDGLQFFLQDSSAGDETSPANTLAIATVVLQAPVQHYIAGLHPLPGNTLDNSIELYNRDTASLIGSITLPNGGAIALHANDTGSRLVALGADGRLYILDPARLTVVGSVPVSPGVRDFIFTKSVDDNDLILAGPDLQNGAVYAVDPAGPTVLAQIACDRYQNSARLAFNPETKDSYVWDTSRSSITVIGSDFTVRKSIQAPIADGSLVGLLVLPGGVEGTLLLTQQIPLDYYHNSWNVLQYDVSSGSFRPTSLGQNLPAFLSPDGKSLYTQLLTYNGRFFGGLDEAIPLSISRYAIRSDSGSGFLPMGLEFLSMAEYDVPDKDVVTGPLAMDDRFLYFNAQTYFLKPPVFYFPGPAYFFRLDPTTLQPAGHWDSLDIYWLGFSAGFYQAYPPPQP